MKFKTGKNTIGSTPDQYLSIDPEKANKIAALLIQKYKSRVTPVREIVINGLESTFNAVKEGREFRPVDIHIDIDESITGETVSPFGTLTDESAQERGGVIKVVDHGEGMSPEFMINRFPMLGTSTKDDDEDAIGGFGIGSKSILSMTDYATWRTVKDGVATVLVMSQDNNGVTINHETMDAPGEDNGTTVTIPVDASVMRYVIEHIEREFLDYVSADHVRVISDHVTIRVGKVVDNTIYTASNGVQFLPHERGASGRLFRKETVFHVMVNGAPYPVPSSINDSIVNDSDASWRSVVPGRHPRNMLSTGDIVVHLDQDHPNVIILPSREALVESTELDKLINSLVDEALAEMVTHVMDRVNESDDVAVWLDNLRWYVESMLFDIHHGWGSSTVGSAQFLVSTETVPSGATGGTWHQRPKFSVMDVNADRYVNFPNAATGQGKVLTGEHGIELSRASILDRSQRWKSVLNEMVKITNGRAMGDALLNAGTIDEVIEGGDIAFLLEPRTASDNENTLNEEMRVCGIVPDSITMKDIYDHFGFEFSDRTPSDIREEFMSRVRSQARQSGGTRKKATATPIIVHRYVQGEGFVEVATPKTVPELGRWLRSDDLDDFAGKVLLSPETEGGSERNSDLFTMASAEEADRMIASSGFEDLLIVRSIKETISDIYHTRVYNEVWGSKSMVTAGDFPVRNRKGSTQPGYFGGHRYSFNEESYNSVRVVSSAMASALDYFKASEVETRLTMMELSDSLNMTIDQVVNTITHLEELSGLKDLHGDSLLDVLMDNFTVHDGIDEIMKNITPDGTEEYYSSLMMRTACSMIAKSTCSVFVNKQDVIDTLVTVGEVSDYVSLEDNGFAKVIPAVLSMRELSNAKDTTGHDGIAA